MDSALEGYPSAESSEACSCVGGRVGDLLTALTDRGTLTFGRRLDPTDATLLVGLCPI